MTNKTNKQNPPEFCCWIITLDPQADRTLGLVNEIEKQGLSARTVAAVDGRKNTPALLPGESIDQASALWYRGAALGNAEIGCYLSHLRLIRSLYESGVEKACILEDDIKLEPSFAAVLIHINTIPGPDLIRFMGLRSRYKRKIIMDLVDQHQLVRPLKGLAGTQGYLITRSGMEKVLNRGSHIKKTIDKFYDAFWENEMFICSIEPHIIYEENQKSSIPKPRKDALGLIENIRIKLFNFTSRLKRECYTRKNHGDFHHALPSKMRQGNTARIK
jgi:glycosyl transferase, family 25